MIYPSLKQLSKVVIVSDQYFNFACTSKYFHFSLRLR